VVLCGKKFPKAPDVRLFRVTNNR